MEVKEEKNEEGEEEEGHKFMHTCMHTIIIESAKITFPYCKKNFEF